MITVSICKDFCVFFNRLSSSPREGVLPIMEVYKRDECYGLKYHEKGWENGHLYFSKHLAIRYMKVVYNFVWKVYERGTCSVNEYMVYKRVKVWTSGKSLPQENFVEYPSGKLFSDL